MVAIDGAPVAPHVQAFADEINRRFGFTHILTYPGHQPDQQHALDNFHTRDVMLRLAAWCTRDDVIDHFGIDYVIFNVYEQSNAGEIYNREIARYWRTMEDRGGITQNHHDHCHVSFNKTGSATPFDGPTPEPQPQQEEDMPLALVTDHLGYGPGQQCTIDLENLKNGAAKLRFCVVRIPWDFVGGPRTHRVRIVAWDKDGKVGLIEGAPYLPNSDEIDLQAAKTLVLTMKNDYSAVSIQSKAATRDERGDTDVRTVLWGP